MSGICGYVGAGQRQWLDAMMAAIGYRGDHVQCCERAGIGLAVRSFADRRRSGELVSCENGELWAIAGATLTEQPSVIELQTALDSGDWLGVDGAFAAARWQPATATLTLLRDPFGVRSLYYLQHAGCLIFASELKQLLAISTVPVAIDAAALHKYLTFSFVPGDAVPIMGVRRVLPGQVVRWHAGQQSTVPWFSLRDHAHSEPTDQQSAAQSIWKLGSTAVRQRLDPDQPRVAVYLSGGIDSAAVALWLQRAGAQVTALSLDFGDAGHEREQAQAVATHLGIALQMVPVDGKALGAALPHTVHSLDLPFGDAVTVPQVLLGQAAQALGITQVWNGEFGDQLLGGWTQKPMLAAALYAEDDAEPEEQYLRAYHRFYGVEEQLYTPDFAQQVGGAGQRRAHLRPYLGDPGIADYLTRVRLADIALKGCQNIVPRAERIAAGLGLDVQMPLLDRQLAQYCLRLPPELKLNGACEKYALKLALQNKLPPEIVWRRKFGMGAPATDWLLGPLKEVVDEVLGEASLKKRGLFRPQFVTTLRQGRDHALETRRRRVGEKLWALLMLELWLRQFVDGRGQGALAL